MADWRYIRNGIGLLIGLILTSVLMLFGFEPGRYQRIRGEQTMKYRRRALASPVQPLPATRPRSLSNSEPNQNQSLLLSRLPIEIRLLLWTRVVGQNDQNDVLHLDLEAGGIKHQRCCEAKQDDKLGFEHDCWRRGWPKYPDAQSSQETDKAEDNTTGSLLSLLLVCKSIYCEAIDVLYQYNTFDIRRTDCVIRLPDVILPHRMQCIRSINFSTSFDSRLAPGEKHWNRPQWAEDGIFTSPFWTTPDDLNKWPRACEILSSFRHLQRLHISLLRWHFYSAGQQAPSEDHEPLDDEAILFLLTPLKSVHAADFQVRLRSFVCEDVKKRLGSMPFDLLHPDAPVLDSEGWDDDDDIDDDDDEDLVVVEEAEH